MCESSGAMLRTPQSGSYWPSNQFYLGFEVRKCFSSWSWTSSESGSQIDIICKPSFMNAAFVLIFSLPIWNRCNSWSRSRVEAIPQTAPQFQRCSIDWAPQLFVNMLGRRARLPQKSGKKCRFCPFFSRRGPLHSYEPCPREAFSGLGRRRVNWSFDL